MRSENQITDLKNYNDFKKRLTSIKDVGIRLVLVLWFVEIAMVIIVFSFEIENSNLENIGFIFVLLLLITFVFYRISMTFDEWLNEMLIFEIENSKNPFNLILRSFNTPFTKDYRFDEGPVNDPDYGGDGGWVEVSNSSVFEQLPIKNLPFHWIFIGGNRPKGDYAVLRPSDKDWFAKFEILADKSRAILIVPGQSISLQKEIHRVISHNLGKAVFIMPPTSEEAIWSSKREDEWQKVQRFFLVNFNIGLPKYRKSGSFILAKNVDTYTFDEESLYALIMNLETNYENSQITFSIPSLAIKKGGKHIDKFYYSKNRNLVLLVFIPSGLFLYLLNQWHDEIFTYILIGSWHVAAVIFLFFHLFDIFKSRK